MLYTHLLLLQDNDGLSIKTWYSALIIIISVIRKTFLCLSGSVLPLDTMLQGKQSRCESDEWQYKMLYENHN